MKTQPNRQIHVSADEPIRDGLSEEWLRKAVGCGLEVLLEPDDEGQVRLLVTGDSAVQALNRDFRGLDEVTDVLSFSTSF